ncbi:MAG: branched-chain amino acid ABC transporter permease [Ruminococcaceae bacterium]|nr:branched-chain amino acid ABC transporter permease [Oscillospiraceae bacterium]
MNQHTPFKQGLKDGIPIGLGYLSVSIGIGIAAVGGGLHIITALLMSMTNLTSAGQAAGISIIAAGGTLIEIALVQLVINLRYALMGISLSQRLDTSFTTGKRLFLGAFITDEIYAVASAKESVNTKYMCGLAIIPYIGWAAGTLIGASAGTVLPVSVTTALGMALYGMFVAIVVPAMKKSCDVTIAVCIAAVLSTLFKVLPFLSCISYGFAVILSSVIAAAVTAFLSVRRQRA